MFQCGKKFNLNDYLYLENEYLRDHVKTIKYDKMMRFELFSPPKMVIFPNQ